MLQALKSIRASLVNSFKDGVYWRESVFTRTDDELEEAANRSVSKSFLAGDNAEHHDPIIIALRRIVTPKNANAIRDAIEEIQHLRNATSDVASSTSTLEEVVALQRVEINNLSSKLTSALRDAETLRTAIDENGAVSSAAAYDVATKALHNSRMREAELRNLASGVIDLFHSAPTKTVSSLGEPTRKQLRELVAKNAMEAYEGVGAWVLSEIDKAPWYRVANNIISTLEAQEIALPSDLSNDTVAKISNSIFQAFCVHYGLDPNPTMLSFGAMTAGQVEIYDRLRNVSRLAANAVVGRHLDDNTVTPSSFTVEENVFSTLENKNTP